MKQMKKTAACAILTASALLAPLRVLAEAPEEPGDAALLPEGPGAGETLTGWQKPIDDSFGTEAVLPASPEEEAPPFALAAEEEGEAQDPRDKPPAAPAVSEVRFEGGSGLRINKKSKYDVSGEEMAKLALLLPGEVTVLISDGRDPVVLPLAGAWTPDLEHLCWTNRADAAGLPADVTDPDGLLQALRISCLAVNMPNGSLTLEQKTTAPGASNAFLLWRSQSFAEDRAVLWQVKKIGDSYTAARRFDKDSPNFSTAGQQYRFAVASWSPSDSGEWYAVYYRAGNPGFSYVVDPCSVSVPGSVAAFLPNGGRGTMADAVFRSGETRALPANAFTRDGYVFTGWNTAPDGSGTAYAPGASVRPAGDLRLYAQWSLRAGISALLPGAEGAVTVTCAAPAGATVVCAAYDAQGRMLEVQTARTAGEGTADYSFRFREAGSLWSAFLLDENSVPLCPSKSV